MSSSENKKKENDGKIHRTKVMVKTFVNGAFETLLKDLERKLKQFEINRNIKTILTRVFFSDQPAYWEESWRPEETCHTKCKESPSAYADEKTHQE